MKTDTTSIAPDLRETLENEEAALAPAVRRAFASIEGPSPRVLAAIHREALAHLAFKRHSRTFFRTLAAAAAFALLLGGAIQIRIEQQTIIHTRDLGHLLNIGEAQTVPTTDGAAEIASRLLSIQGLDDDSFFLTSEETEPLWL